MVLPFDTRSNPAIATGKVSIGGDAVNRIGILSATERATPGRAGQRRTDIPAKRIGTPCSAAVRGR
jgi:hypothetical protein